jgi:hypothetical protein
MIQGVSIASRGFEHVTKVEKSILIVPFSFWTILQVQI